LSGLITAAVIAGGAAVAAGAMANKSAKSAAGQMRDSVETFDPLRPNDPLLMDWRRSALDANNYNFNHLQQNFDTAGRINAFNVGQARRGYRKMQPYFDPLQRQIGSNALSFARGELPADVVSSIGRAAAQRGIQSGFGRGAMGAGPGSQISNLNLRNLGLTSLDLSKFGTNLAMQANQQAAALTPALFRPESLMVSPQQAIGYDQNQINVQNEAMRYWNQVQNQARLGNTGAQNQANQNAINTQLAGQQAQALQIGAAGQAVGGMVLQYSLAQQNGEGGGGGMGAMGGTPSQYGNTMGGAPQGGYVPLTGGSTPAYYRLA
jgi:hypothetical protein